mmetsp:Transcript_17096/g.42845  ORF Transcript_17096/g.42845 Transcript_17096/m.42845 type:complete len:457 (+) Transcript_17096:629-1999(+)
MSCPAVQHCSTICHAQEQHTVGQRTAHPHSTIPTPSQAPSHSSCHVPAVKPLTAGLYQASPSCRQVVAGTVLLHPATTSQASGPRWPLLPPKPPLQQLRLSTACPAVAGCLVDEGLVGLPVADLLRGARRLLRLLHALLERLRHLLGLLKHQLGVAQHVAGVGLQLLGGQRHAPAVAVLAQDHDLQLVALLQDLVHVGDPVVADLADVQQAGDAAQVHKGTIGLHRLNHTLDHIADLVALQLGGSAGAGTLVAEHQALTLLIDLQELDGNVVANEALHVVRGDGAAKLADGHEAIVGAVSDKQATLVGAVHLDIHSHILLLQLPDAVPEHGCLHGSEGQHSLAILILLLHNDELALHSHAQHLQGRLQLGEGALRHWHKSRCLVANLHISTVLVDLIDGANNFVTDLQVLLVCSAGLHQLLHLLEQLLILLVAKLVIINHLVQVLLLLLLIREQHP